MDQMMSAMGAMGGGPGMGGMGGMGGAPQIPESLLTAQAPDNEELLRNVMQMMMKLMYEDPTISGNQERIINALRSLDNLETYSLFLRMQAAHVLVITNQIRTMGFESKEAFLEYEPTMNSDYSKAWELLSFPTPDDLPSLFSLQMDTTRVDIAKTLRNPAMLDDALSRLLASEHDYAKGAAVSVAPILGRWADMIRVSEEVAATVPDCASTEAALEKIYKSFPGLPDLPSLYSFARADKLDKKPALPLSHVKFCDIEIEKITVWLRAKDAFGKANDDKEAKEATIGEKEDVPVPAEQMFRLQGGMAILMAFSHEPFPVVGYVNRFVVSEADIADSAATAAAAAGASAAAAAAAGAAAATPAAAAAAAAEKSGAVVPASAAADDAAPEHLDPRDVSALAPGSLVEILRLRGSTEGPADPEEMKKYERIAQQAQSQGREPPQLPPKMKILRETQEFCLRRASTFCGYEGTFQLTQESGILDGSPPDEEDKLLLTFSIRLDTKPLDSLEFLRGGADAEPAAIASSADDLVAKALSVAAKASAGAASPAPAESTKDDAPVAVVTSLVDGLDLD